MKVAIRDDDACYFTEPSELERVYGDVWDRVPVCLATVPFAIGYERVGIPQEHWRDGQAFALDLNVPLTESLKSLVARKRVTIALHGYTHQDYPDGFEFQAAPNLDERVKDGLRYLRTTLDATISVFVPPHNAMSKCGLAAVPKARAEPFPMSVKVGFSLFLVRLRLLGLVQDGALGRLLGKEQALVDQGRLVTARGSLVARQRCAAMVHGWDGAFGHALPAKRRRWKSSMKSLWSLRPSSIWTSFFLVSGSFCDASSITRCSPSC